MQGQRPSRSQSVRAALYIGGCIFVHATGLGHASAQEAESAPRETPPPAGILTVPVAPGQRGDETAPLYRGRPIKPGDAEAIARDLRSMYVVTQSGEVLSLADWMLGALQKEGIGMSEAQRDQFLGNLARAAVGRGDVLGGTASFDAHKVFGPVKAPPDSGRAWKSALKTILNLFGGGIGDDRPRLVRERDAARLAQGIRPALSGAFMAGPFDQAMMQQAKDARQQASGHIPDGLVSPDEQPSGDAGPERRP